jgi:ABC-type spermidine/putrescine transport system permease subunit I
MAHLDRDRRDVLAAAFPLAWMVLTSLKTPAEIMQTPPVRFPAEPSLEAYAKVSGVVQAGRSFVNSAIIATTTTAGILLTTLLAGFAFAKYRFRGRELFFAAVIATMFLPPIVTLIPLYRLVGSSSHSPASTPESRERRLAAFDRLFGSARFHGPLSRSCSTPSTVSAQIARGWAARAASVASSGVPARMAPASRARRSLRTASGPCAVPASQGQRRWGRS